MKIDITKIHQVWDKHTHEQRDPTDLPPVNLEEVKSATFDIGKPYYYIIDFSDFSISHLSPSFKDSHGLSPETIQHLDDIIQLTHPDDMNFVTHAEDQAINFLEDHLKLQSFKDYKVSYNFRYLASSGNYELFNHQALVLTTDQNGNFIRSLNIHTNVNHLTTQNTQKFSIIGMENLPSYLNLEVFPQEDQYYEKALEANKFSKLEMDILALMVNGLDLQSIAHQLFIPEETIYSLEKKIKEKTACPTLEILYKRALSEGWV